MKYPSQAGSKIMDLETFEISEIHKFDPGAKTFKVSSLKFDTQKLREKLRFFDTVDFFTALYVDVDRTSSANPSTNSVGSKSRTGRSLGVERKINQKTYENQGPSKKG